jgi:adenine deaminase
MGIDGIRFMLRQSDSIPFDFFFMLPSCVPATRLETSGAFLAASDLSAFKDDPRVLGLAEMMNFPSVLMGDDKVLEKIVLFRDQIVDGHCPFLRNHELQAYLTAGVRSDHETTHYAEALEKLESGMTIMIREGSTAKNLEELLPLINSRNASRFFFVSDDLHAKDIQLRGHLDFVLRKAVQLGLDPVTAVQLVTRNPAEYFGLKDRGAVAPGYCADIVVFNDLEHFDIAAVYKDGDLVADSGGVIRFPGKDETFTDSFLPLKMSHLTPEDLNLPHPGGKARVIEIVPGQIVTGQIHEKVGSSGGRVSSDTDSDILKLCVVERHTASGRLGIGLVRGFGLKSGALASSVAHDSHNVIAVGVSDEEISTAVEAVRLMGGGLAVASGNEILAKVPLEIAGLMSVEPAEKLVAQLEAVNDAASELGCRMEEPFMALSFLALPVIPELKLTDRGLVDVNRFEIVPLFLSRG